MFDVSFSELMLIGVIALIVIGPQRLPKVARTIGHLVGRAQRYVNDVKSDIQREVNLDEVNKVKAQMEEAARSVKSTVNDFGNTLSKPVDEAKQAIDEARSSVNDIGNTLTKPVEEAKQALNEAKASLESLNTPSSGTASSQKSDASAPAPSENLPLPGLESTTPEAAEAPSTDSAPATNTNNPGASS